MNTESSIAHYTQFLAREGYRVLETTDDFVTFEARNHTYVLAFDRNDPHYFRLILPNFANIDHAVEERDVKAVASDVTAQVKMAKVFLVEGHAWATAETLVTSPEHTDDVFARMLELLDAAADHFTARFETTPATETAAPTVTASAAPSAP